MTNTPITAAAKICQYHEALERRDSLAVEIHADADQHFLPDQQAAELFHRRRQGAIRYEHKHTVHHVIPTLARDIFACCQDAHFLIANPDNHELTKAYCPEHVALIHNTRHGWIHSIKLELADDNIRNATRQMQDLRRERRQPQGSRQRRRLLQRKLVHVLQTLEPDAPNPRAATTPANDPSHQ